MVSNHLDLARLAKPYGVPFDHVPVSPAPGAEAESALLELVGSLDIDLMVLARYMRVLSPRCRSGWSAGHQHPPLVPAELPRRDALPPGTCARRQGDRRHGPLRDAGAGRGPDHRPGRGPGGAPARSLEQLVAVGRDVEAQVLARAVRWHAEHQWPVTNMPLASAAAPPRSPATPSPAHGAPSTPSRARCRSSSFGTTRTSPAPKSISSAPSSTPVTTPTSPLANPSSRWLAVAQTRSPTSKLPMGPSPGLRAAFNARFSATVPAGPRCTGVTTWTSAGEMSKVSGDRVGHELDNPPCRRFAAGRGHHHDLASRIVDLGQLTAPNFGGEPRDRATFGLAMQNGQLGGRDRRWSRGSSPSTPPGADRRELNRVADQTTDASCRHTR